MKNSKKPQDPVYDRITDLMIIQLASLGVGWQEIRNTLGVDGNRVALFTKPIKKALRRKAEELAHE